MKAKDLPEKIYVRKEKDGSTFFLTAFEKIDDVDFYDEIYGIYELRKHVRIVNEFKEQDI